MFGMVDDALAVPDHVFEVLGEASRRAILQHLLRTGEQPVGSLVEQLSLSQPTVSKHLKVLRDAGFVQARVDAQRRIYSLRAAPLREAWDWLQPYRMLWEDRLDALEDHLDQMQHDEAEGGAR
jgi:DNA-binding transcriptional ArsR family regulator